MELKDKILLHKDDVAKKKLSTAIVDPALYKLLWKLGFNIKPPLFSTYFATAISSIVGGAFLALALVIFQDYSYLTVSLITFCVIVTLMCMTYFSHRYIRKRHEIPDLCH